jgi:hypothetical protein
LRQTLAQALHQVDDLGLPRLFFGGQLDVLAFDLALDDLHQVVAVLIVVLARLPVGGEAVHQRFRHIELRLAYAFGRRKLEVRDVDEFVAEAHHGQHQRLVDHFDGGQVLGVAKNEGGDADALSFAKRFAQQRVGAFAALGGKKVVGGLEEPVVDLIGLDEVDNVDGLCLFDGGSLEVFLGQDDEVTLRVLVALDQVLPGYRMAVADADAFESNRRLVACVQHAEVRPVTSYRRMELDRDVDQSE